MPCCSSWLRLGTIYMAFLIKTSLFGSGLMDSMVSPDGGAFAMIEGGGKSRPDVDVVASVCFFATLWEDRRELADCNSAFSASTSFFGLTQGSPCNRKGSDCHSLVQGSQPVGDCCLLLALATGAIVFFQVLSPSSSGGPSGTISINGFLSNVDVVVVVVVVALVRIGSATSMESEAAVVDVA